MPTASKPRLVWRAGDDRIAHATRGRELRTLCGLRPVAEQLAWPEGRRCLGCASLSKEETR